MNNESPAKPVMTVNCPTCSKTVEWSANSPFRPFCSERCKLIDLGEWAAENHRIPAAAPDFLADDQEF
jgi:uncharacterized protein